MSEKSWDNGGVHGQWDWQNGAALPSKIYIDKFFNRTIELINKYNPGILYFDDSKLPFWPIDNAGLKIAAHFYNKSFKRHKTVQSVICGKILDEQQRKALVWDIERGQANEILPNTWQTDTCLGNWHYDKRVYENNRYKSAKTVIQTLVDVVSKNGNYLLNIPVRGNGSIDDKERAIIADITEWMKQNSESIYGTRPWTVFGEGPAIEAQAKLSAQGFNEGKGKPFTDEDIRFATKKEVLYATALGKPVDGKIVIKSLSANKNLFKKSISKVQYLPTDQQLGFRNTENGLEIDIPENLKLNDIANVVKIV